MKTNTREIIEYEARLLLQVDNDYDVPTFNPARNRSGRTVWRAAASANGLGVEANSDGSVKRVVAYSGRWENRVEVTDENVDLLRREMYFRTWEYLILKYGRERFAADLADRLATAGLAVEVRASRNPDYYAASIAVEELSKPINPLQEYVGTREVVGELASLADAIVDLIAQQNSLKTELGSVSVRLKALAAIINKRVEHGRSVPEIRLPDAPHID